MDNRIDGAVMTFNSITDQKGAQELLKKSIREIHDAQELVRAVFDMNSAPMTVLNEEGKIVIANKSFSEIMNVFTERSSFDGFT